VAGDGGGYARILAGKWLMQLRFVASESAFDYFRATRDYLETHGKPVAFYSDKHSIFQVNSKDAAGGEGVSQFGRALSELNIDMRSRSGCPRESEARGTGSGTLP
jgi:hypothetical protein